MPTQRAYLYVERDREVTGPPYRPEDLQRLAFEPGVVTDHVGLAPTSAWRRGDPDPRANHPPRRFSRWKYGLPATDTYDTEEVVVALLDAIEPYATRIADACAALAMRAGVMVVIRMRGESDADGDVIVPTPAVGYSARTVRRLARMNLSIHHDQYVEVP